MTSEEKIKAMLELLGVGVTEVVTRETFNNSSYTHREIVALFDGAVVVCRGKKVRHTAHGSAVRDISRELELTVLGWVRAEADEAHAEFVRLYEATQDAYRDASELAALTAKAGDERKRLVAGLRSLFGEDAR